MFLLAAFSAQAAFAQGSGFTGIFGGGPFYKNAAPNITEIENSGFTEAIVWSVEVSSTGDLNFNGEFPLTSAGVYIGNELHPDFPGNMAKLKQGTVRRVTFSIGSSNYGDWEDITNLVNTQGTGPGSILYEDFAALKAAIPLAPWAHRTSSGDRQHRQEESVSTVRLTQIGVLASLLGTALVTNELDLEHALSGPYRPTPNES